MNLFDIGIVIIVGIAIFLGFSKGFFKSVSSVLGWLVSFVLAILLAEAVATALCSVSFVSKYFFNNPGGFSFANFFYGFMPESLKIDMDTIRGWLVVDGVVVEDASEILVDKVKDQSGLIGMILSIFESSYIERVASAEVLSYNFDDLAQILCVLLANSLLVLFTGILLLIVFKIISSIVLGVFKKSVLGRVEGVSVTSRFFGMILGGVKGIIICAVLLSILGFMIDFPFFAQAKKELYEKDSFIARDFTDYVTDGTKKLLSASDIHAILESAGYKETIDISTLPNAEPEEPDDGDDTEDEEEEEAQEQQSLE